ncbi:hypothetical protein [Marinobacterium sp. BA1]|uniref:hypothetical protein n=1 Tax=Marinobacterium sp. BA1 TaxID=3138931 RepID=UPI0032E5AA13
MSDPRKYVQIHLPKTPTICLNLQRIKSMWPSLICELLYTGIITRSQSGETTTSEDANTQDYFNLHTRYTPSYQMGSKKNGANFVARVVANAIENSTPEELGVLLANAIEVIGIDNIVAYSPDALGCCEVESNKDVDAINPRLASTQQPTINSVSSGNVATTGLGNSTNSLLHVEHGTVETDSPLHPVVATMSFDDDAGRSYKGDDPGLSCDVSDVEPSSEKVIPVYDPSETYQTATARPDEHSITEHSAHTSVSERDEHNDNYSVESNNENGSSGKIENTEDGGDASAQPIHGRSAHAETPSTMPTSGAITEDQHTEAEFGDKRTRLSKYAHF